MKPLKPNKWELHFLSLGGTTINVGIVRDWIWKDTITEEYGAPLYIEYSLN